MTDWAKWQPSADLVANRMAVQMGKAASQPIDPLTALRKREERKYATMAEPPTMLQKATNMTKAIGRLAGAVAKGNPLRVTDEERDRRLAICRGCEYWNEGGNIGLGECRHSKCGCTRFKHGLTTERCPIGKW
jgi:hypothetical protein